MSWYKNPGWWNVILTILIILLTIISIKYFQVKQELTQVQGDLIQCKNFNVGFVGNEVSCIGTSEGPGCIGIAQG